jgi:hypothetical protein
MLDSVGQNMRSWFAGSLGSFYQALREVGVNAIVALTPVWAGAVLSVSIAENKSWLDAIYLNTSRGDLFLSATAAMAPIILYVTVKRGDLPRAFTVYFPGGWFYMVCVTLLFGASIVLFSVKRLIDTGVASFPLNTSSIYIMSVVIYVMSTILVLAVTFVRYRIDLFTAGEFRSGDEAFMKAWRERDE